MGYPFFGNITVTRDCEEECLSYDGIGASKPKSCCYTDLCTDDTKSSSGVRSSPAALGLVALKSLWAQEDDEPFVLELRNSPFPSTLTEAAITYLQLLCSIQPFQGIVNDAGM
ncbi:hypothetical protein IHE44_0001309 [Lamprotornis superbus]|uniref:Uncharacterized protein n=1 Tax=Lamprotornis superbus TaxID=245042 RepID=A0A835NPF9_9PASS|nr:hypothetical protein IHE44_0001309 [Lamprotornis superbus]